MTKFKSKKVRSLPADVSTWVFVFQGFLYVPVLTLILRLRLCLPCLTSSEYSCTPFIVDVDTDDTARIQLARSWTRPAWARHYMWSFQQTCITCIDLYDLYFVRGFIWFCFPGKSWLPWSFEIGRIEQWLGHARAKLQLGFRTSWQSCQEMTSAMKTVLAQLMIEDESLAELISIAISPDPKVGLLYLNHDHRARPHVGQMWAMMHIADAQKMNRCRAHWKEQKILQNMLVYSGHCSALLIPGGFLSRNSAVKSNPKMCRTFEQLCMAVQRSQVWLIPQLAMPTALEHGKIRRLERQIQIWRGRCDSSTLTLHACL